MLVYNDLAYHESENVCAANFHMHVVMFVIKFHVKPLSAGCVNTVVAC